jgi:hypothetical protein
MPNDLLKLDLNELRRQGQLHPDHHGLVRWPDIGSGITAASVVMKVDHLILRYRIADRPGQSGRYAAQRVALTRIRQHLGGERIWLVCPDCQRRCGALYYSERFRCRRCVDLRYPSQHEPLHERLLYRAKDVRARLGGSGSMTEPFPERPKGMRQATYERLRQNDRTLNHRSLMAAAKAFRLPGFERS